MATVIHKKAKTSGKERAEVAAWAPVPVGTSVTAPENTLIKFSWDHFNRETLLKLPEWIQNKIHESSQYLTGANVQMAAQDAGNAEEQPAAAAEGSSQDQAPPPPITADGKPEDEIPF